jgi:predicted permease
VLRQAWRRLAATPIFTVFAVVSLALGVGVTTAIHSAVLAATSRARPLPNQDHLALVVGDDPFGGRQRVWRGLVSRADFADLAAALAPDVRPAASAVFAQSLSHASLSELAAGEAVDGPYFELFGVRPAHGRLLQDADDVNAARVLVVSHRFWRTRLSADPDVVGSAVRLGGEPFEIVGVAPEGFDGLGDQLTQSTSIWVPLAATTRFPSMAAPPADPSDRDRSQLAVVLPLPRDGEAALSARVSAIGERLDAAFPVNTRAGIDTPSRDRRRAWVVEPVGPVRARRIGRAGMLETVVLVIVGLVLVVACTNLANLVLARGSSRDHERAVRRALGASRARLVAEQLAETGTIAALAAVAGYVVTRGLIVWFTSANLPISRALVIQLEPRLDVVTLGLAASALLASLVVFGLVPAMQLSRGNVRDVLSREGGSTGRTDWRTRQGLIAVQVAISVAFVLMAAFMARIALAERGRPAGIDLDRLAVGMLNVHLPPWNAARVREAIDRLMQTTPGTPGIESVAVASGMPFGLAGTPIASITALDTPFLSGESYPHAPVLAATPSVFATLGVPILRGRSFDGRDGPGAAPVAVLSELAARQVFGTADAVGRQFMMRNAINMRDQTSVSRSRGTSVPRSAR